MEDTGTFDQTECKVHISRALRENGMVKFMVDALNKAGCPWDPDKFTCITCDAPVEAGFDKSNDSIKICGNNVTNYNAVSLAVTHELIHAFDDCRAHANWNNLHHHACSEIRASNLSGECKWSQEFFRGNLGFHKQQKECVRRRATLSVSMNPNCPDEATAQDAVKQVWERCYRDSTPFDRVP